jgi:hypothetical protein
MKESRFFLFNAKNIDCLDTSGEYFANQTHAYKRFG